MFLPYLLLRLSALVSLAILAAGIYFLWTWRDLERAIGEFDVLNDGEDWRLYLGLALLAFSFLGRFLLLPLLGRKGDDAGRLERGPASVVEVADGSRLRVESYGPAEAPALVFTHGWGMDSTMWWEARRQLGDRFRLVVWDLPGLGGSRGPKDGHYRIERFADALGEVAAGAGGPVVLVGHSIGGMTVQTFCRRHPQMLGREVAGIVLENTTYTNPLKTTVLSGFFRMLRWPLIEPMMRLDIWLKPVVWLVAWQSYLSGGTHLAMRIAGFGARPTRRQLDQTALLATRNSPSVQAKGNLAMMRWDVSAELADIEAPALVFVGGNDLITKAEAGRLIAHRLPRAQLIEIERAGHMGPMEEARRYNDAIARFADEVLMRGAIRADQRPETSSIRSGGGDAGAAQTPPSSGLPLH